MEIIKWREERRREIIENAKKWVMALDFKVSAILIGSYARGDFNLWSDVDILLISYTFKGTSLNRLRNIDTPPGFQIIPLNIKEFEKLYEKRDILVKEASRYGIILRDDLNLYRKIKNSKLE